MGGWLVYRYGAGEGRGHSGGAFLEHGKRGSEYEWRVEGGGGLSEYEKDKV